MKTDIYSNEQKIDATAIVFSSLKFSFYIVIQLKCHLCLCISSESTPQYHSIGIVRTDFKIRPHFIAVLEYTIAIDFIAKSGSSIY